MLWYWQTMDWTAATVTRTLDTGTVGMAKRHCSDLKLASKIDIGDDQMVDRTLTPEFTLQDDG